MPSSTQHNIQVKLDNQRSRRTPRIDYRHLNSTGNRVIYDQDSSLTLHDELNISEQFQNLTITEDMPSPTVEIDTLVLLQEIEDVIDESPVDSDSIEEVGVTVSKLQEQRTSLRRYEILLKSETVSNPDLPARIASSMMKIKDYIKCSKDRKQKLDLLQKKQLHEEAFCKERSMLFVISDLRRSIADLINDFRINLDMLTDIELMQLKTDLSSKLELIGKAANKYENILQTPLKEHEVLIEVKEVGEQYELMMKMKAMYISKLDTLLHSRDVYRQKLFSESKLNIRLEKFSGYTDTIDFYTFKSDFNKVHERSTPKHLLPDLLKNNYLKDPALSMVKTLNDIDAIWSQLQFAYGDAKLMLTKKLNQVSPPTTLQRC